MPMIQRAYKYRIELKKSQVTALENQFSMCRYLYNWLIQDRKLMYEHQGVSISFYEQKRDLPPLKQKRPWFKGVHSQVLQDVVARVDKAYQSFFRSGFGYPKLKKRGQWTSITYPQYRNPVADVIKVPKLGDVKVIVHRPMPTDVRVKTLTITREGGHYYACFSFEQDLTMPEFELKQDGRVVGIDLGCIDLYVDSDGEHVEAPRCFRKAKKHLAQLQRRFSKEPKYTKRWYKLLRSLQKTHAHIVAQRHDFLHKAAHALLAKADVIVHEDLSIALMTKRPKPKAGEDGTFLPNGASAKAGLNLSILDAGWGKFLHILRYKAQAMGKVILTVPPHYTSQACSQCGIIVKKSLSHRTHRCDCGFVAHRDHNAALNIRNLGLVRLGLKPLAA